MDLPNQTTTWQKLSDSVTEFEDWREKHSDLKFNDRSTELLAYLTHELNSELNGSGVQPEQAGTVYAFMMNMVSMKPRVAELYYAYLNIVLKQDTRPAEQLIKGYRLYAGTLHSLYLTETQCQEVG